MIRAIIPEPESEINYWKVIEAVQDLFFPIKQHSPEYFNPHTLISSVTAFMSINGFSYRFSVIYFDQQLSNSIYNPSSYIGYQQSVHSELKLCLRIDIHWDILRVLQNQLQLNTPIESLMLMSSDTIIKEYTNVFIKYINYGEFDLTYNSPRTMEISFIVQNH